MIEQARELIKTLDLESHPEGGYYRRVYESDVPLREEGSSQKDFGERQIGSAILYLLPSDEVSKLHRIDCDEMWHFYHGSSLQLHLFDEERGYESLSLGTNLANDEMPQRLVSSGTWFGASVEGDFALVGCTLWPEFTFKNFELADSEKLIQEFPEQATLIKNLT